MFKKHIFTWTQLNQKPTSNSEFKFLFNFRGKDNPPENHICEGLPIPLHCGYTFNTPKTIHIVLVISVIISGVVDHTIKWDKDF